MFFFYCVLKSTLIAEGKSTYIHIVDIQRIIFTLLVFLNENFAERGSNKAIQFGLLFLWCCEYGSHSDTDGWFVDYFHCGGDVFYHIKGILTENETVIECFAENTPKIPNILRIETYI